MKKIKFLFAFVMALFAVSCQQKPSDDVQYFLSNGSVEVSGLDYECATFVDNKARTITIYVDYLDKENIKALGLKFKDLEVGVTVSYAEVFNYSDGATQTVKFTKLGVEFPYVVSVEVGKASPKFVSLKVKGIDAMGGEVKMSGADNLAALPVEFEVSPAEAKVFVGDNELTSGDEVDFTDKLNGVTFDVRLGEASASLNVKVVTTGINSVKRVWGAYVAPKTDGVPADWFGTKVTGELNIIRTVAMSDTHVFLSKDKDSENGTGGVYAISISDVNDVKLLSQEGIPEGTRFFGISALENTVLAAAFTTGSGATFAIYAWKDVNGAPEKVLEYVTPENVRFGDKLVAEGTWDNGKIWVHDATSGKKEYCFAVSGGKVNATPTIIDLDTKMGNYGTVYPYAEGQYIWAGSGSPATLFNVSGTSAEKVYEMPTSKYSSPMLGVRFFSLNGEDYMAYTILRSSYMDGQLRITAINREDLQASLEAAENHWIFRLGDPEAKEDAEYLKNANASGDTFYREIGGKHYVASYACGTGLSLFVIE